MVDIRSRAWRGSSIVGLIVEDLWSVSFLTIQRTASSALLPDLFPVLLFSIDVLVFAGNTLLGLLFSSQC
ncbi:hypothetical protein SO802_009210 [Lithocarpus litseifolius]|uniref:Uncharacterized protein n=1 Tax=Lithocarpus litseifolius TaxID=425828 RepID=A0AAW2DDB5_9ROSI